MLSNAQNVSTVRESPLRPLSKNLVRVQVGPGMETGMYCGAYGEVLQRFTEEVAQEKPRCLWH